MATAKEISNLLAALTVAALIGTLALSMGLLATYAITSPGHFASSDITTGLYVWSVAVLVSVPVALLVGAPAYLLLQNLGLFNWLSSFAVGTALGFLVSLSGISGLPWQTCSGVGAGSALIAWIMLRRSNYSFKRTR